MFVVLRRGRHRCGLGRARRVGEGAAGEPGGIGRFARARDFVSLRVVSSRAVAADEKRDQSGGDIVSDDVHGVAERTLGAVRDDARSHAVMMMSTLIL